MGWDFQARRRALNNLDRVADCDAIDAIVWQIQIDIGYWSSPHFLLFDTFA